MSKSSCEECLHFVFDEDYECWSCEIDLDMDEYERFVTDSVSDCPYYQGGDEYTIVRKQN